MSMADKGPRSGSDGGGRSQRDAHSRGSRPRWPWLLLAALVVVAGGAVFARWLGPMQSMAEIPLNGEMNIVIRSAGGAKENVRIDEPGALPVRADDWMSVEVHYNQPAFTYLVWLDCQGQVVPLYPWNY